MYYSIYKYINDIISQLDPCFLTQPFVSAWPRIDCPPSLGWDPSIPELQRSSACAVGFNSGMGFQHVG